MAGLGAEVVSGAQITIQNEEPLAQTPQTVVDAQRFVEISDGVEVNLDEGICPPLTSYEKYDLENRMVDADAKDTVLNGLLKDDRLRHLFDTNFATANNFNLAVALYSLSASVFATINMLTAQNPVAPVSVGFRVASVLAFSMASYYLGVELDNTHKADKTNKEITNKNAKAAAFIDFFQHR